MSESAPATCVLYDGSCPVCSREISMYRELKADNPIHWVDVSCLGDSPIYGQEKSVLMQRFHVLTADGELISGAKAFVYMWQLLPRWRYLALISKVPGVLAMMEMCYRLFLGFRPRLQKMVPRS